MTEQEVYDELVMIASEKGIYPDDLYLDYDEENGEYVLWNDYTNTEVATKKMEKIKWLRLSKFQTLIS